MARAISRLARLAESLPPGSADRNGAILGANPVTERRSQPGARIETGKSGRAKGLRHIVPHLGARIEATAHGGR